ncbi:MAG: glycosyltransferase [Rhodospirillales bacterium]|nr:glycosyltransferase [Rhodospirillales bacterium]
MPEDLLSSLVFLPLAAWGVLLFFRGGFWRADQRLADHPDYDGPWPDVAAVIPARDEEATIGLTVSSLLAQDYPGRLSVLVVDDNSSDRTAETVRSLIGTPEKVKLINGEPVPEGWTGKLWALQQGVDSVDRHLGGAEYILFTDADIEHDPASLRRLVAKAEMDGLGLVSLMVKLRFKSYWERALLPAYVFFFQKLYPFPRVNDKDRPEAAAAGGCMLVRRDALLASGGLEAIRDRVIDDCALAARIKAVKPVWLGLTGKVHSLRAYDGLTGIWMMVARSAFVQLRHSLWLLLATVLGMTLFYLAPPVITGAGLLLSGPMITVSGLGAWLLSALAVLPTLRFYKLSPLLAPTLPFAALLFVLMTLDSARRHWQGQGAAWKGRTYG